jgi:predicted transcriptional regulator
MDKKISRLRRAVPTRRKIAELRVHRLTVFRSNLHIYANIISPEGDRVLVSASTVEPEVRQRPGRERVYGVLALDCAFSHTRRIVYRPRIASRSVTISCRGHHGAQPKLEPRRGCAKPRIA